MPYGLLVDIGRKSAYPLRSTSCKNAETAAVIIGDYLRLQCPEVCWLARSAELKAACRTRLSWTFVPCGTGAALSAAIIRSSAPSRLSAFCSRRASAKESSLGSASPSNRLAGKRASCWYSTIIGWLIPIRAATLVVLRPRCSPSCRIQRPRSSVLISFRRAFSRNCSASIASSSTSNIRARTCLPSDLHAERRRRPAAIS